MYVIGIDPGPLPGIVRLRVLREEPVRIIGAAALQVTPNVLGQVLDGLDGGMIQALAYERFVVGRRAARSATPAAGAATRDMIGRLEAWAEAHCDGRVHSRAAADVKPWAVDKRLHAAGLLDLTAGMRHARDAARHALFCAVKDYGLPDPLSSKAGAR
jgi:hypothetical protein